MNRDEVATALEKFSQSDLPEKKRQLATFARTLTRDPATRSAFYEIILEANEQDHKRLTTLNTAVTNEAAVTWIVRPDLNISRPYGDRNLLLVTDSTLQPLVATWNQINADDLPIVLSRAIVKILNQHLLNAAAVRRFSRIIRPRESRQYLLELGLDQNYHLFLGATGAHSITDLSAISDVYLAAGGIHTPQQMLDYFLDGKVTRNEETQELGAGILEYLLAENVVGRVNEPDKELTVPSPRISTDDFFELLSQSH
jgi:hypothetical protein